ncbi:hypothetical protein MAR_033456, partial [Mya arenaria]
MASIEPDESTIGDELDMPFCEPCKESKRHVKASRYCNLCNEYLCDECTDRHKQQKVTKRHDTIDKHASNFCHECNEYLCAKCVIQHKVTKMTIHHAPVPIKNLPKGPSSNKHFCNPCSGESQEEASMYCEICTEYLCEHCVDYHKRQKATKAHILTTVLNRDIDVIPCDVCKITKTFSPSQNFCVDCEERHCKPCTEVHLRRKITKNHQISKIGDSKLSNAVHCTVCVDAVCKSKAVKYCEDCIEYMCETCTEMHQRNKLMKVHNLLAIDKIKETKCWTCEKIGSVAYCMECDKMICWQCRATHVITKKYNGHKLVSVTKGYCDETRLYCEPCEGRDLQQLASAFCLDCDRELLCSKCAKKHKARKKTQSHIVVMDIAKFEIHKEKKGETQSDKDEPEKKNYSRPQALWKEKKDYNRPGKPISSEAGSDFIDLSWGEPLNFQDGSYFQVLMKDVDPNSKWKFYNKEFTTASGKIEDINSNTKFVFRVRVVHEHGEGPYSPESDVIITFPSPASRIVYFSTKVEGENPTTYALPLTEHRAARDVIAKSRQFILGSPPILAPKEKTIILIGETGTGKSTLVDGLVNYILDVKWGDAFRYTIKDLEEEETQRCTNQALSQTEWITQYTIFPEKGGRVPYCLNIIDTPGFGDTRGLQRNQEIVEQIRKLFSAKHSKQVCVIDAICFLLRAPDARLTAIQSYIFQSIMSLFGKDIKSNICSLITFADGIDPPVLAAMKESKLPFGMYFTFNNSCLFARNVGHTSFAPMLWKMGIKSFQQFFSHLEQGKSKSLQLSKDVLDERLRLDQTTTIKDKANFTFEVDETRQKKRDLPAGQHVTNCTLCHFTCHENCDILDNDRKKGCSAMDGNGFCTVCPNKCKWDKHANTPYIFKFVTEKVKKRSGDMLKKYQEAEEVLLTHEIAFEKIVKEFDYMIDDIEYLMTTVKECNERLTSIALWPNPLSTNEYIDLMIENEKLLKKDGFIERIHTLNEFRKKELIMSDASKFTNEAQTAMRIGELRRYARDGNRINT